MLNESNIFDFDQAIMLSFALNLSLTMTRHTKTLIEFAQGKSQPINQIER